MEKQSLRITTATTPPAVLTTPPPVYKCTYCPKSFTKPSALKPHIYTHTGEKPYQCHISGCLRRFAVLSNLRRHLKIHSKKDTVSSSARVSAMSQQRRRHSRTSTTATGLPPLQTILPARPSSPPPVITLQTTTPPPVLQPESHTAFTEIFLVMAAMGTMSHQHPLYPLGNPNPTQQGAWSGTTTPSDNSNVNTNNRSDTTMLCYFTQAL